MWFPQKLKALLKYNGMSKREVRELGPRRLEGSDLVTATKIALGWMAARQWRPDLADSQPHYRDSFRKFIADAVEA